MGSRRNAAAFLALVGSLVATGCRTPVVQERAFRTHAAIGAAGRFHRTASMEEERAFVSLAQVLERPGYASTESLVALANLADRIGSRRLKADPLTALPWFRDAAAYSRFALARNETGEDANVLRSQAIARHNHAVSQLLRCAGAVPQAGNPKWRSHLAAAGVEVASPSAALASLPLNEIWVAADLDVKNLEHVGWNGLGVPLVTVSHFHNRRQSPDRFLPEKLNTPATGVVSTQGGLEYGAWRTAPVVLGLFDPKVQATIPLAGSGGEIRLAGDLTAALESQFLQDETRLADLALGGLLRPDQFSVAPAILMQAPHQPGKIPVLFIHGLASNPGAWMKMVNRLQADPFLRNRYEFWFAYYPTGATLMSSALRIRGELHALRESIDPTHADPALDQMVVVGHSLGGVLTKQLVQSSGRALEAGLFTRPISDVKMSSETQAKLSQMLYFEPEPSVRRVVYIASPHRGSNTANRAIGRISSALVSRPEQIEKMHTEIIEMNGEQVFLPEFRRRPPNSIDNLEWNSPILKTLSGLPIAPGVEYHSIVATMWPMAPRSMWTDGVVSYESAHRDGAASELVVKHNHLANETPEAAQEVRRILRLHAGLGG